MAGFATARLDISDFRRRLLRCIRRSCSLGPKSYAELPTYQAGWDVSLMPFAHNAATCLISPTKTLEYLAAGRPLVSTAVADVVGRRPPFEADFVGRGLVAKARPADLGARGSAVEGREPALAACRTQFSLQYLPMPRHLVHVFGTVLLLTIAALTLRSLSPPHPSANVGREAFSVDRALAHLRIIAAESRAVGSPGHQKTREYIASALREIGLDVRTDTTSAASLIAGGLASSEVYNVVGTLRGNSPGGRAVLLSAHYDSVPESHGASDDGSGVVTLLETARVLAQGPKLENDVIFLFTDAEEIGLLGAQAFVRDSPDRGRVAVALNFDARGTHGAVTMFATSEPNGDIVRVLDVVHHPVASSFVSALAQALPNDTDATVWKRAGILTGSFAYADGVEHYHRATDSLTTIDPASIAHAGDYAVTLGRHFADAMPADTKAPPNRVYFDLFGAAVVSYSLIAARVLAGVLLLVIALLLWSDLRARHARLRRIFRGAAAVFAAVAAAVVVAALVRLAIAPFVPFFFLLARAKSLVSAGLLAGAGALLPIHSLLTKELDPDECTWGGIMALAILLVPMGLLMPDLSAPIFWPLVGLIATRRLRFEYRYLGLVPTVYMMTGLTYATVIAVGGTMPWVPAIFSGLGISLAVSQVSRPSPRVWRFVVPGPPAAALVAAAIGCSGNRFTSDAPQVDSLFYGMDSDTGDARWASFDTELDAWVRELVPSGATRQVLASFTRWGAPLPNTEAKPIAFVRANVAVTAVAGGFDVSIAPREAVRCVSVWQEDGPAVTATYVNGKPLLSIVRFSPEIDAKAMRLATGDQSREGWHLEHCGFTTGPLRLRLTKASVQPATLRIVERRDGLPMGVRPRDPWLLPRQDADVTVVSQKVQLL